MPHRRSEWDDDDSSEEVWSNRNWSDESDDDWSGGYADDYGDEDDEPTIPCPYCGREIHEEAERCPECGTYISAEDSPPPRKPWWIVVGTLLVLYIVYRWIAG